VAPSAGGDLPPARLDVLPWKHLSQDPAPPVLHLPERLLAVVLVVEATALGHQGVQPLLVPVQPAGLAQ